MKTQSSHHDFNTIRFFLEPRKIIEKVHVLVPDEGKRVCGFEMKEFTGIFSEELQESMYFGGKKEYAPTSGKFSYNTCGLINLVTVLMILRL